MTATLLYTYTDAHTGEWDNYAIVSDDGQTMMIYAYQPRNGFGLPGDEVVYRAEGSTRHTRHTNPDPELWEENGEAYAPGGQDLKFSGDGNIMVDGVAWEQDHVTVPELPAGEPDARVLRAAPTRHGWVWPTPDATVERLTDDGWHPVIDHADPMHREYVAKHPDEYRLTPNTPERDAIGTLYLDQATGVVYRLSNYYRDGYGVHATQEAHYAMLNLDGSQSRGPLPSGAVPIWSPNA